MPKHYIIYIILYYLFTLHYHGKLQLALYTYIHRYEHEAILKPKTENNIGAPSAPQKHLSTRAQQLSYIVVVTHVQQVAEVECHGLVEE